MKTEEGTFEFVTLDDLKEKLNEMPGFEYIEISEKEWRGDSLLELTINDTCYHIIPYRSMDNKHIKLNYIQVKDN